MKSFLMIVEVIVSILLIVVVVAQSSKSTGMGAVTGGANSVFGGQARGVDALLYKITIVLAIIFGLLSLYLDIALNTF